jgi:hypothetical protein
MYIHYFLLVRTLLYYLVNLVDMVTASICNCSNVPVVPFFVCPLLCIEREMGMYTRFYSLLTFLFLIK